MTKQIMAFLMLGITAVHAESDRAWTERLPKPVFDGEPGFIELYNLAWKQAHEHIKIQSGIPQSPYMDEGLWDHAIWIWDTCFMVQFCKYAPEDFPGIESLRNFYVNIHDLKQQKQLSLSIWHPDNPPLFAWCEADYYRQTHDTAHVIELLDSRYLEKHFEWFDAVPIGYSLKGASTVLQKDAHGYRWNGVSSGMDNTPRGRTTGYKGIYWLDALAQQALSAQCIAELNAAVNRDTEARKWAAKSAEYVTALRRDYWDEQDSFFYDINIHDFSKNKVVTPASFWPLMCNSAVTPEGAVRMAAYVTDSRLLGGIVPFPTVARNAPEFDAQTGNYWRGAVWLPTAYMSIKALERYNQHAVADEAAEKILRHMLATFRTYKPHTIWECYAPNRPGPSVNHGERVRADFCGWSALGPISLFLENVIGLRADAPRNELFWRLHHPFRHGVENYRFGDIVTDLVYENGIVTVRANRAFTLVLNAERHKVSPGIQRFRTEGVK